MIEKGERLNAQRKLLADLGQSLTVYEFNPKPSGQDFFRKTSTGRWVFHLSFIPHRDDFDLTSDVAVRIDQIEDLVNKYDTKLSLAEHRKSMTLGAELGNLSKGHPIRWTISDVADISGVCDKVAEAYEKIGWPFLSSHSDVASVHRVLTSSAPHNLLLAPLLGPRCMRAVASAYLLGNVEELDRLVSKYEADLRQAGDLYLEDFLTMCRELQQKH